MKIPLKYKCSECDEITYIWIDAGERRFEFICSNNECDERNQRTLGPNIQVGTLVLMRSFYELSIRKDYNLAIVAAASAVDCELSRLYRKWRNIDGIDAWDGRGKDPFAEELLAAELRKKCGILDKLKMTMKILNPIGFDQYVKQDIKLWTQINKGFKSLDANKLSRSICRNLFYARNNILHDGKTTFSYEKAKRCYNIARLVLFIFSEIEKSRKV